jgi:hypothetical protein
MGTRWAKNRLTKSESSVYNNPHIASGLALDAFAEMITGRGRKFVRFPLPRFVWFWLFPVPGCPRGHFLESDAGLRDRIFVELDKQHGQVQFYLENKH